MQYWAPLQSHHLLLWQEVDCLFKILCNSWVFAGEIKSSGWTCSKTMKGVRHPCVQTLGEGIWSHVLCRGSQRWMHWAVWSCLVSVATAPTAFLPQTWHRNVGQTLEITRVAFPGIFCFNGDLGIVLTSLNCNFSIFPERSRALSNQSFLSALKLKMWLEK